MDNTIRIGEGKIVKGPKTRQEEDIIMRRRRMKIKKKL